MEDEVAGDRSRMTNESPTRTIESTLLIDKSTSQVSNKDDVKSVEIDREKIGSPSLEIAEECIESFIHQGLDTVDSDNEQPAPLLSDTYTRCDLKVSEPPSLDNTKEQTFTSNPIQENALGIKAVDESNYLKEESSKVIMEAKSIINACLLDTSNSDDRLSIDADDDHSEKEINTVDREVDEGRAGQQFGVKKVDKAVGKNGSKTDASGLYKSVFGVAKKKDKDKDKCNNGNNEGHCEEAEDVVTRKGGKKEKKNKHHTKQSKKKKKKHKKEKKCDRKKEKGLKVEEWSDEVINLQDQVFDTNVASNSARSTAGLKDSRKSKNKQKLVSVVTCVSSDNATTLPGKEKNVTIIKEDHTSPRQRESRKVDSPPRWSSERTFKCNESRKDELKDGGCHRKVSTASKLSEQDVVDSHSDKSLDKNHKKNKNKRRRQSREEESRESSHSSDGFTSRITKTEDYKKKTKRTRSVSSEKEENKLSRRHSHGSSRTLQSEHRHRSRKNRSKSRESESDREMSRSGYKDRYSEGRQRSRSRSKYQALRNQERSRSRSKDRKRSRSRLKDRKRSRSRLKDRKRSRSRSKDRQSKQKHKRDCETYRNISEEKRARGSKSSKKKFQDKASRREKDRSDSWNRGSTKSRSRSRSPSLRKNVTTKVNTTSRKESQSDKTRLLSRESKDQKSPSRKRASIESSLTGVGTNAPLRKHSLLRSPSRERSPKKHLLTLPKVLSDDTADDYTDYTTVPLSSTTIVKDKNINKASEKQSLHTSQIRDVETAFETTLDSADPVEERVVETKEEEQQDGTFVKEVSNDIRTEGINANESLKGVQMSNDSDTRDNIFVEMGTTEDGLYSSSKENVVIPTTLDTKHRTEEVASAGQDDKLNTREDSLPSSSKENDVIPTTLDTKHCTEEVASAGQDDKLNTRENSLPSSSKENDVISMTLDTKHCTEEVASTGQDDKLTTRRDRLHSSSKENDAISTTLDIKHCTEEVISTGTDDELFTTECEPHSISKENDAISMIYDPKHDTEEFASAGQDEKRNATEGGLSSSSKKKDEVSTTLDTEHCTEEVGSTGKHDNCNKTVSGPHSINKENDAISTELDPKQCTEEVPSAGQDEKNNTRGGGLCLSNKESDVILTTLDTKHSTEEVTSAGQDDKLNTRGGGLCSSNEESDVILTTSDTKHSTEEVASAGQDEKCKTEVEELENKTVGINQGIGTTLLQNASILKNEPLNQNSFKNTNNQFGIPVPLLPPPPPPPYAIPTRSSFMNSPLPRGPPHNIGNFHVPPVSNPYLRPVEDPRIPMLNRALLRQQAHNVPQCPVPQNRFGPPLQPVNQNTYNQLNTDLSGNVVPQGFALGLFQEHLKDNDNTSSQFIQHSSLLGLPTSASVIPFLGDEDPKIYKEKNAEPSNNVTKTDAVDSNHKHASMPSPVDMDMSSPEDDIIEQMNEEFWENERKKPNKDEAYVPQEFSPPMLGGEEFDPDHSVTSPSTSKKKKKDKTKRSLDSLPKTKVQSLIDKLHRQARVEEEVKIVLKDYYKHREINKKEYKDILRKSVPQVANSDHSIDPERIRSLVKKYVAKVKGKRLQPYS